MALSITETDMFCDVSQHSAMKLESADWSVSWLPGWLLDRNQAITAMTIAEMVSTEEFTSDNPMWTQLEDWASELGMTASEALARVSAGPLGETVGNGGPRCATCAARNPHNTPCQNYHVTPKGQYQDLQTGEWKTD